MFGDYTTIALATLGGVAAVGMAAHLLRSKPVRFFLRLLFTVLNVGSVFLRGRVHA